MDGGLAGEGEGGVDDGADTRFFYKKILPICHGLPLEGYACGVADETVGTPQARPCFPESNSARWRLVKGF